MGKVAYITLGCPKNQADTEHLAEMVADHGFGYTEQVEDADACIVNTCCFIDEAKRESIDTILTIAQNKKGKCSLVVMGCMGKKYKMQLEKEMPEVDAIFGIEEFDKVLQYLTRRIQPGITATDEHLQSPRSYTYIKIADGCNRRCSFCVIPSIRGRLKSVKPDTILREVEKHLHNGVKELVLVAQDVTSYGMDMGINYGLKELLKDITAREGDFWVRLLYLHPSGIDEPLIQSIAKNEKICNYFDIPFQHSAERILNVMKRGHTERDNRETVEMIRKVIPDAVLRSTLIVGFPGETEEDFLHLRNFVETMRFERLGIFKYSDQKETPAHKLGEKIPERRKQERFDEIMKMQSEISLNKNQEVIGGIYKGIIDEFEGEIGIGRLYSHAPEIDGAVMVHQCRESNVGSFVQIKINDAYDYDLVGEIIMQ